MGRVAATLVRADGGESVLRGREGELRANSTTITEAGTSQKCRGLTRFWCTDGYAVCGYAEAAATVKDIVVSVDGVGVSKTPGLRVNAPPSADRRSAGSRRSCFSNRILSSFQFS